MKRSSLALLALLFLQILSLPLEATLAANTSSTNFAELVTEIEYLRKKGLYPEAISKARQCLALAEDQDAPHWITESLYQIALLFYLQDDYEESVAYLEIALSTVRVEGDVDKEADLLNLQGNLYWKLGQFERASSTLEQALSLFRSIGRTVSMASAANNIGNVRASSNQHLKALESFQQGLEWVNQLPPAEGLRMRASLLSNIGESLVALGRFDEAEPYLLSSLEVERELNEPRDLAFSYTSLGNLYAAIGDPMRSRAYHENALEIQLKLEDQWASTITRLRLAEALLANSQPDLALGVLTEGFDAAKALRSDSMLQEYTNLLRIAHSTTGNDAVAAYYADLSGWFGKRHEARNGAVTTALPSSEAPSATSPTTNAALIRWATISILLIVIVLLFVENGRLRRLDRSLH